MPILIFFSLLNLADLSLPDFQSSNGRLTVTRPITGLRFGQLELENFE